MSSRHLGPESPRPFCIISEDSIRRKGMRFPHVPDYERYSFGEAYEKKMCELIHKYLELGTDDHLCYVGEEKGSLAPMLQRKFCLLEPITTVVPGHIHYEESPNHRMLPIKVASVGAEEYFRIEADHPPQYDKVLLKDAVLYIDDTKACYENIKKTLTEFGRVLIVHRPAPMNTLPIFNDAKERLTENDQGYMDIIRELQSCNYDVQWEIECLPIVMPKMRWMAMVRDRFPTQLEIVSNFEVKTGLRELSEGVLKYGGTEVEFVDRLLFITASKNTISDYPVIHRFGTSITENVDVLTPNKLLKFKMEITPDIKQYVTKKPQDTRRKSLLEWN